MHQTPECPICQGTSFHLKLSVKDHSISHETFSLIECDTCQLLVTNPQPSPETIPRYYESATYISHAKVGRTLFDKIYILARRFTLRWKVAMVKNWTNKNNRSLLDFGCGTGDFLRMYIDQHFQAEGVEPSDNARHIAQTKTGTTIHKDLTTVKHRYNAITAWHVLEHVQLLNETIQKLTCLLEENGTMFIAVPNHQSFDAKHYREKWAGYDVPRHLWHFNPSNMKKLLDKHGLELTRTVPMKLDAFYVSMLSEKYRLCKPSLKGFIAGFVNGLISNLKASTGKNYSSLVYIARKK